MTVHFFIRKGILTITDFMHPFFAGIMPLETFRYAACGGANTALNVFIYFVSYNYLLQKRVLHLPFIAISPHIAALLIASAITLPVGFYLTRYIVFQDSDLRKRIQLFRYFSIVCICMILNYFLLKLLVNVFHWYPSPSQLIITAIMILFSYFTQRAISFGKRKELRPKFTASGSRQ